MSNGASTFHVHGRGIVCPMCGVERKPTGSRMQDAIHFAGNTIPVERIERELAAPPPDEDAGFWDEPGFMGDWLDTRDQKTAQYFAGELPPVELTQQEIKTLKEGVAKGN